MIFEMGLFSILIGVAAVILLAVSHDGKANPSRMFRVQEPIDTSSFMSDFDLFRNDSGLIQDNPRLLSTGSGNDLRYFSQYIVLGFGLGVIKHEGSDFRKICRSCYILPGLLGRCPTSLVEGTRIDDIVSVATASQLLDTTIIEDIYEYGSRNYWVYRGPNERRSLKSWMGRFPGFVAHLEYCQYKNPFILKRIGWIFSILWCALTAKENQDEWVLSHMMIIAYENSGHYSWIQDKLIKYWKARFYKSWPGGMRALLTKYFGHEHPLAKWAIDP